MCGAVACEPLYERWDSGDFFRSGGSQLTRKSTQFGSAAHFFWPLIKTSVAPTEPQFSTENLGVERSHGPQNKALSKGQNAEGRVWCVHRRPHMCPGDLAAPQAAAHGHIGRAAGPGWQLGGALGRREGAEKGLRAFSVHLHNSRNCGKTCARIRAHPNFFAYVAPI